MAARGSLEQEGDVDHDFPTLIDDLPADDQAMVEASVDRTMERDGITPSVFVCVTWHPPRLMRFRVPEGAQGRITTIELRALLVAWRTVPAHSLIFEAFQMGQWVRLEETAAVVPWSFVRVCQLTWGEMAGYPLGDDDDLFRDPPPPPPDDGSPGEIPPSELEEKAS